MAQPLPGSVCRRGTPTLHPCPTFPSHPAQSCPLPRGLAAPPAAVPGSPLSPQCRTVSPGPLCSHTWGPCSPSHHSSWPALTASKMKNCIRGWDRKANLTFSAFFYSLGTPSPGQLLVRGHGHNVLGFFSSVPGQGWGQLLGRHGTAVPHWRRMAAPRAAPMATMATEPCLPLTAQGQQRFGVI